MTSGHNYLIGAALTLFSLSYLQIVSSALDNGFIAFASNRTGAAEIFIMEPTASGANATQLTFDNTTHAHPAFSFDGIKLAFTQVVNGTFQIFIHDLVTKESAQITNGATDSKNPYFSPDGSSIVYDKWSSASGAIGSCDIHQLDLGTREDSLLISLDKDGVQSVEQGAKYSYDGSKILFASNIDHQVDDLYLLNLGSREVIRLTYGAHNNYSRTWSPDGAMIAYNCAPNGAVVGQICALELNEDGTPKGSFTTLTTKAEGTTPVPAYPNRATPTFNGDVTPVWSPDGKKIAFASNRESRNLEVYEMNADGTNIVRLTNTENYPAMQLSMAWQPIITNNTVPSSGHVHAMPGFLAVMSFCAAFAFRL